MLMGFCKFFVLTYFRHRFLLCRYAELNRKALEDADLYARIGRVRTPSPTPASNSDRGSSEPSTEAKAVLGPKGHSVGNTSTILVSEESSLLKFHAEIVISSDSEHNFCQCEQSLELANEFDVPNKEDSNVPTTSSEDTISCLNSNFHPSETDLDNGSSSSTTLATSGDSDSKTSVCTSSKGKRFVCESDIMLQKLPRTTSATQTYSPRIKVHKVSST